MKRLVAFVGVGALALAFMSSTCSMKSGEVPASNIDKLTAAPTAGITFKKKTFDEALKEAKKSGKLVFIDAYTDWCGPCKRMAATSFKDPKVGELFNENFVNLKVEMEKDADGPNLARKYSVRAYPTLLIVDGNGKLIKQSIGMKSSAQLIALANSVL
jgi:thiol:disulfide interchange protein